MVPLHLLNMSKNVWYSLGILDQSSSYSAAKLGSMLEESGVGMALHAEQVGYLMKLEQITDWGCDGGS